MPEGPGEQLILLIVQREQALARAHEYLTNALRELRDAGDALKATNQHLAREIDAEAEGIDQLLTHIAALRSPARH